MEEGLIQMLRDGADPNVTYNEVPGPRSIGCPTNFIQDGSTVLDVWIRKGSMEGLDLIPAFDAMVKAGLHVDYPSLISKVQDDLNGAQIDSGALGGMRSQCGSNAVKSLTPFLAHLKAQEVRVE